MKTFSQKSAEIKREWYVIDAASLPLGKLAVVIADKLMGKSKVTYTPHIDNGDYVIVLNAKNIQVTGNKMVEKMYYRHSGFPGGLTELKLEEIIEKNPAYAIKEAVKGMLPKNKLAEWQKYILTVSAVAKQLLLAHVYLRVKVKSPSTTSQL